MSADDQVSLEGDLQGSVSMAQGDGYSRVVKRTVVKSEGDHTEVRVLYILCVFINLILTENTRHTNNYVGTSI